LKSKFLHFKLNILQNSISFEPGSEEDDLFGGTTGMTNYITWGDNCVIKSKWSRNSSEV